MRTLPSQALSIVGVVAVIQVDPQCASNNGRRDIFIHAPIGKGCICTCTDDDPHDGIVSWPEGKSSASRINARHRDALWQI
jgi:hypothetical protein